MRHWSIADVMTTNVATVEMSTPYREIIDTLASRMISAVPVIDGRSRVLGIVSEADLLHKMEFASLEPHTRLLERKRRRTARAKADAETAGDLMSSPAVVVKPGDSLATAAKIMDTEQVKRLPVVDVTGRLVGIVSRRDLLRVYLREDADIRREVTEQVLLRTLWIEPDVVTVTVERGVVTVAGTVDRRSTVPLIVRLVQGVAGVVEVVDELTYQFDDISELNRRRYLGATVRETVP